MEGEEAEVEVEVEVEDGIHHQMYYQIFSGRKFQRVERNPGENVVFNEIPGPSRAAMTAESVSDHFKLFIPDTLVQSWVTETNRYARQSRLAKPTNMKWTEVTFEEILAYLGIVLLPWDW